MNKKLILLPALALLFFALPAPASANIGDPCQTDAQCNQSAGESCDTVDLLICVGSNTGGAGGGTGSAGGLNLKRVTTIKNDISTLINSILVPLLIAVSFIVFLYGVFNYFILGGADAEKRQSGRTFVMYGVVGFVIIISLWGIVALVNEFFNLTGSAPKAPQL